ncbi:MAG: type II toxin-antitoxin system RelE/ParE family toxin [Acidobacteriaceae bacterium]
MNVALGATLSLMAMSSTNPVRTFKTSWFAKAARKAHITDDELCSAILQVALGRCDDLGGGIYKKRLSKNQYRSIILAKVGTFWVYEYLFAKQDRANIDDDELVEFRKLVKAYGTVTPKQVNRLLQDQDWMEICNGNQT